MSCWTSSVAHTRAALPPYSPLKPQKLSERHLHYPETPTIATCNLEPGGATCGHWRYDADELPDGSLYGQVELDDDFAIHPIFAEHNFHDMRYDALVPALRLATLLLTTPALMQYWYAAFFSLEDVAYANDSSKTYKAIVRKKTPLTTEEVAQVQRKFLALATHLRFYTSDMGETTGGSCKPHEDRIDDTASDFSGNGSDITIAKTVYKEMCEQYETRSPYAASAPCYLGAAATLCHEIAHAVQSARFGYDVAVGFEDQLFSEEGLDWCSSVFGGEVDNLGDGLGLHPWPSQSLFEHYMRFSRGGGMFAQAEPSGVDVEVHWRISQAYINRLFTKAFWAEVAAGRDPDALKVPRILGYRQIPAGPPDVCSCINCRTMKFVATWSISCADEARREPACRQLMEWIKQIAQEFPGWTREELEELPCERAQWGAWPWGFWYHRKYAKDAGFDPQTYGIPEGYKALADGSVVAAEYYNKAKTWEASRLNDEFKIAETALEMLASSAEQDGPSDKVQAAKKKLETAKALVRESFMSEELSVNRMVAGLSMELGDVYHRAHGVFLAEIAFAAWKASSFAKAMIASANDDEEAWETDDEAEETCSDDDEEESEADDEE